MTKKKVSLGWIFLIIMACIIILIIWGIYNKSMKESSVEELKPGTTSNHPHVFSYAADGETIWLGTHSGVYEWKNKKWLKTLPGLSNNDVMGLEINSSKPGNMIVSGHGFIKRTVDGGTTWSVAEQGLPNKPKPDVPDAHQLTMDPKNPNHLFTLLASKGKNLFESKDGGQTWLEAGSIIKDAYSIAILPDKESSLLVAAEDGLYRYDLSNGGTKEVKVSNEPSFQLLSLQDGTIISMGEGGFQSSRDLKTWSPLKVPLNGEMPLGIKSSIKDNRKLLIVTNQLNVYESKDNGLTWSQK